MASSSPVLIPAIAKWIWNIRPETILDVGVGFGRYGFLCREILDVWSSRYFKKDWKVRIDGVEIFPDFITDVHRYLYDSIFIEDINVFINKMDNYDLVIFGDVLEHMQKDAALNLVKETRKKCKWILIQSPVGEMKQDVVLGNVYEKHLSAFYPEDFLEYYPQVEINNNIFIVLIRGEL